MSYRPKDLLRLVEDYGEPLNLVKVTTKGTYNVATGKIEGAAGGNYPFVGYFYRQEVGVGQDGSVVKGNRRVVVPFLGNTFPSPPNDNDQISGTKGTFSITDVETIDSDGSPVCYLCWVSS